VGSQAARRGRPRFLFVSHIPHNPPLGGLLAIGDPEESRQSGVN
jgi:hypothetical protein